MNKTLLSKSLVIGIILFFIGTGVCPSSGITIWEKPIMSTINGNTLYVGGSGPDNYTKIQYAINDAVAGDTVFVYDYSSPYYELLVINKSINLIGEDRETTVIDGNYKGNVLTIQANNVTVRVLTIKNTKNSQDAWHKYNVIKILNGNRIIITDNKISIGLQDADNRIAGVYLKKSSNNIIKNNIFFENNIDKGGFEGITVTDNSNNNNISNNDISGYNYGITIEGKNNIIIKNDIYENKDGILVSGENRITKNRVYSNEGDGIIIGGSGSGNIFLGNIIENNGITDLNSGIRCMGNSNIFTNNHIENNPYGFMLSAEKNIINKNNFIDNKKQVDIFFMIWFPNLPKLNQINNNYWSDSLGIFPKLFLAYIYWLIPTGWVPIPFPFLFPVFDWNPAKKPYDIENINLLE